MERSDMAAMAFRAMWRCRILKYYSAASFANKFHSREEEINDEANEGNARMARRVGEVASPVESVE